MWRNRPRGPGRDARYMRHADHYYISAFIAQNIACKRRTLASIRSPPTPVDDTFDHIMSTFRHKLAARLTSPANHREPDEPTFASTCRCAGSGHVGRSAPSSCNPEASLGADTCSGGLHGRARSPREAIPIIYDQGGFDTRSCSEPRSGSTPTTRQISRHLPIVVLRLAAAPAFPYTELRLRTDNAPPRLPISS